MSSKRWNAKVDRRTVLKLAGAAVLARASGALADRRRTDLRTRLSVEFGLRTPLSSAGMAFVGLTDLASAVTNAGAIGVYGVGLEPPPAFAARLQTLREETSGPFGVDFLVGAPGAPITTQDHIDIAADARVPIVAFHLDVPDPAWIRQLRAAGSKVWVQCPDVDQAQRAVAAGADGVIAQGLSAGGHNRNSTIPTLELVQLIRRAVHHRVFVLASGGISSGRSLVQAIRAGADGGWAGTVFVAAAESYAHPGYKARLIAAKGPDATVFTRRFGPEAPGQQQRVLRNRATDELMSAVPTTIGTTTLFPGVLPTPYTLPKYSVLPPTRDTTGDLSEMSMPAGADSVQAVRAIRPAADIVDDFIADSREHCDRDDD